MHVLYDPGMVPVNLKRNFDIEKEAMSHNRGRRGYDDTERLLCTGLNFTKMNGEETMSLRSFDSASATR